jgi:hypothetical protein
VLDRLTEKPVVAWLRFFVVGDGLTDLHESRLEEPESAMASAVPDQRLADPGGHLKMALDEDVDPVCTAYHLSIHQSSGQKEVIRRAVLDPDAHTGPIDLPGTPDR